MGAAVGGGVWNMSRRLGPSGGGPEWSRRDGARPSGIPEGREGEEMVRYVDVKHES